MEEKFKKKSSTRPTRIEKGKETSARFVPALSDAVVGSSPSMRVNNNPPLPDFSSAILDRGIDTEAANILVVMNQLSRIEAHLARSQIEVKTAQFYIIKSEEEMVKSKAEYNTAKNHFSQSETYLMQLLMRSEAGMSTAQVRLNKCEDEMKTR